MAGSLCPAFSFLYMQPYTSDKTHNSTSERTIRYIGFSFAGLAFVLLLVCVNSLRIARQVQHKYEFEVLKALNQLKLVNTLHRNEDLVHNLLMSHIETSDPTRRSSLRAGIKQGQEESIAAARALSRIIQDTPKKELLQQIIKERAAYYSVADSLMRLSDQNRTAEAEAFSATYLEPGYQRHEQYLNKLSNEVQAKADSRLHAAITGISSSIHNQMYLLFLAMASAIGAAFIIRKAFNSMREENAHLNIEMQGRNLLELELSEQRREYKMLFNRNPVPMWVYDRDTFRFLEVNRAAEQEYGYTEEEFLQMTLFDIRPEEERERLLANLQAVNRDADARSEGFIHKRKDGTLFRVEVRSHTLPRKHEIHPRLVVAVNVQEREHALEQLRKNEKLLREVSSSVPGAVFQYQMERDGSFCFPYISEGVQELCAVTPEEVYRDPLLLYRNLHPNDLAEVQRSTVETYQNLTPWEQELRVWQPEKKKYQWVRGHSLPSSKGNGTVLWNGTFIDITKQKEAQEELTRNQAKLKALLDSSLQAIFLLDENLNVLSFNKEAAADVHRYLLKELKAGHSMVDFVTHSQVPSIIANHARAMRGETVMYEAGQGDYWHEITYQPVISPEQTILGVALNIRDISEQKKSFETIKRNELQLARAQQLAKLGSWEYHVKQDTMTWSTGT